MDIKVKIQTYLRNGNSLDKLKEAPYFIKVKIHSDYPNIHMFKYNQLSSDFKHAMVRESRGIILDSANNWEVVSYPYNKFFNYNEPKASKIDWSTAKVYKKLDGSLMTMYHYDGKWHVSSSGVPDASGAVPYGTFAKLFWDTWYKHEQYQLPVNTTKCYIFELMTPHNQIVVTHLSSQIVLHGVRCLKTLKEERPEEHAALNKWKVVESYEFDDVNMVIEAASNIDPTKDEGYIICDDKFNRVKIKSPQYVALAHTLNSVAKNPANLIKVVQNNEGDEVISTYPHLKEEYDKLKKNYDNLYAEIAQQWEDNKNLAGNSKEFAAKIKGLWYKSCLFGLRTGKVKDIKEWMSNLDPKELKEKIE